MQGRRTISRFAAKLFIAGDDTPRPQVTESGSNITMLLPWFMGLVVPQPMVIVPHE